LNGVYRKLAELLPSYTAFSRYRFQREYRNFAHTESPESEKKRRREMQIETLPLIRPMAETGGQGREGQMDDAKM